MSATAAFFDLDRTLIDANSGFLWALHERRQGLSQDPLGFGVGSADLVDRPFRQLVEQAIGGRFDGGRAPCGGQQHHLPEEIAGVQ